MSNMNPAGAGWEPDPTGRHELRYWDGTAWTEHVSDAGGTSADPAGRPAPGTLAPPGAGPWAASGTAFGPPSSYGQPPAYGQPPGYGYAPVGVAGRPQSLKGLATGLTVLLIVTSVAALVFAAALVNRASILEDPFGASFDELQDADDAAAGTAGFFVLALLATAVVWIIWQYRHAENARLLGQTDGLSPGWAIGGWFIPIGSFILPQLQLKQAAEASDPTGARRSPPVLIVWWVLWVIAGVVGFATRNNGAEQITDFDDIESFRTADQAGGAGMLVVIAAAVAAMVMVRALSDRQHQSLAARGMPV